MEKKSISRSELEVQTSLALPTVMRIVSILIDEGLVIEVGKGDSSGGRKPVMLKINSDSMFFIGVSVQRVMHVVLADMSGNIVSSYGCNTVSNINPDLILAQILEGIETVVLQSGIMPSRIKCAGIGIPGTKFSHIKDSGFPFDVWADFDISIWQKSDKFPYNTEFQNVARLGALGEWMFGAALNCRNFIYIFADYGVGAGVVIDGKLFTGSCGVACEFGHTTVGLDGRECYCGNRGCLEMYCSTSAIIRRYLVDDSGHAELKSKLLESPNFSIFADAAYGGDRIALGYIEESARILGIGLAGLINLFNPSLVIIGGELAENCAGYTKIVTDVAKQKVFRNDASVLKIIPSSLKDEASVRGAVALAMAQVFDHVLPD